MRAQPRGRAALETLRAAATDRCCAPSAPHERDRSPWRWRRSPSPGFYAAGVSSVCPPVARISRQTSVDPVDRQRGCRCYAVDVTWSGEVRGAGPYQKDAARLGARPVESSAVVTSAVMHRLQQRLQYQLQVFSRRLGDKTVRSTAASSPGRLDIRQAGYIQVAEVEDQNHFARQSGGRVMCSTSVEAKRQLFLGAERRRGDFQCRLELIFWCRAPRSRRRRPLPDSMAARRPRPRPVAEWPSAHQMKEFDARQIAYRLVGRIFERLNSLAGVPQ